MTRLWMGRCRSARLIDEYNRDAMAKVRGAAYSPQSVRIRAPTALCSAFAPSVDSEIASSRSRGSSMCVASDVNIAETLLPPVPTSSAVRTDTGHTRRGADPPARCHVRRGYRRNAPAQMASTTSFTFTSSARRTAFSSPRSVRAKATVRCGEMDMFQGRARRGERNRADGPLGIAAVVHHVGDALERAPDQGNHVTTPSELRCQRVSDELHLGGDLFRFAAGSGTGRGGGLGSRS